VLNTRGVADVKDYFNFLKEIRSIFDRRQQIYLNIDEDVVARLEQQEAALHGNKARLEKAIARIGQQLKVASIPINIDLNVVTARGFTGMRQLLEEMIQAPPPHLTATHIDALKPILSSEPFQKSCASVDKAAHNYSIKLELVERRRVAVEELRQKAVQLERATAEMGALRDEIEAKTDNFASRFGWRARFRPLV
jgi:hypothetical protein